MLRGEILILLRAERVKFYPAANRARNSAGLALLAKFYLTASPRVNFKILTSPVRRAVVSRRPSLRR